MKIQRFSCEAIHQKGLVAAGDLVIPSGVASKHNVPALG